MVGRCGEDGVVDVTRLSGIVDEGGSEECGRLLRSADEVSMVWLWELEFGVSFGQDWEKRVRGGETHKGRDRRC